MNPTRTRVARSFSARHVALAAACVLALPAAHSAAAADSVCTAGEQQVQSLTVTLAQAPATVRIGRVVTIPVTVDRISVPAPDVLVTLSLRHGGAQDETFVTGRTDAFGRVSLATQVPHDAKGTLYATVAAHARVVELPCHQEVTEYGSTEGAWGRAIR